MTESDEELAKKEKKLELEAAGNYASDLFKVKNKKLKRILKHNLSDELKDHATKLADYVLDHEAKEAKKKQAWEAPMENYNTPFSGLFSEEKPKPNKSFIFLNPEKEAK